MATYVHPYPTGLDRLVVARQHVSLLDRLIPRRCMVVSRGLILAGLSIPFLILFGALPSLFILYLAGFIIAAAGSTLAFFFCGDK